MSALPRSLAASRRLRPIPRCTTLSSTPALLCATLPLHTRSRLPTPLGRRHFSVRELGWSVVETGAQTFSAIHNTGIPWYITIPLVALGLNFTLRLPLGYYTRTIFLMQARLAPLAQEWSRVARDKVPPSKDYERHRKQASASAFKARQALHKRFGCRARKIVAAVLLQTAPYVVVSMSMRALCYAGPLLDQSLQYGGILWFTDLTATGPMLGLPLICSLLFVSRRLQSYRLANLTELFGNVPIPKTIQERTNLSVRRFLVLYPVGFLFVGLWIPNCVLFYFASGLAFSNAIEQLLKRILPQPEQKKPTVFSQISPDLLLRKEDGKR